MFLLGSIALFQRNVCEMLKELNHVVSLVGSDVYKGSTRKHTQLLARYLDVNPSW